MSAKSLKIFIVLVFLKSLVWLVSVPLFQIPDEPSHFSIVEFVAENGRRPPPRGERVTPSEVMSAAAIVNFDWQISHPVWRGFPVDWRKQLLSLNQDLRRQATGNKLQTSLKRPPLYYYLAAPFYWLGGNSFLGRIFAVRSLSLIFHLATVWLAFLIGGFAVAALVAFQPMLSFISSGVHYDPLAIFLATAFVYFYLKRRRRLSLIVALTGILVKPDLIFLLLVWLGRRFWGVVLALVLFLAAVAKPLVTLVASRPPAVIDRFLYLTNLNDYSNLAGFFLKNLFNGRLLIQFKDYLITAVPVHLVQVFPWYWGTFGWLEAPLPAPVFIIVKVAMLASLLGWIKYIHRHGFPRKMVFFLGFALIQALVVIINDWQFFASEGAIYGIQGRYFFPAIVAQMIILVFGWRQWLSEKLVAKLTISLSIGLNVVGLFTVYRYFGWVWGN